MKEIDSYIKLEFDAVRNELKAQLDGSFDIDQKKEFLATYIPEEIVFRSNALVDTLRNLLMNEAIKYLEKYDISIQNKFFDEDFESRFKNMVRKLDLQLILNPEAVSFSRDPRFVNGMIAGGSTFVLGSAVTAVFNRTSNLGSVIISGIATLILSVLAYKVTYGKFTEEARNKLYSDLSAFITTAEQQLKEWLYSISELFETEFNQFLNKHQLQLK